MDNLSLEVLEGKEWPCNWRQNIDQEKSANKRCGKKQKDSPKSSQLGPVDVYCVRCSTGSANSKNRQAPSAAREAASNNVPIVMQ